MSESPFPVMEHMTVKQVREYLENKTSIIIPIGVIEQHGYHLPLKTDALIATHLGRRIGAKTKVLVAPTMYNSFSGGNLPGTINISPATMSLVVSDMLISLVAQGFRNIYLFLCHGGSENARALNDAIRMLLGNNPAFEKVMIALLNVWDFDPSKTGWKKALSEGDWHAGWLETSLIMALEPQFVQMDELELDPEPFLSQQIEHPDNYQHAEKIVDDKCIIPRMSQRSEIKVGVMGHPEHASAKLGKRIADEIVASVSEKIIKLESNADGVYKEVQFTPEPMAFQ